MTSLIRKVTVALAFAAPCVLFVASADASPVRKAHVRQHHTVTRRVVSAKQAFARLASRQPERRVFRHPPSWLKSTRGAPNTTDHDAAITNAAASLEACQPAPAFRPLEFLLPVQAQPANHDGFAQSSPRAPPVFG